MSSFLGHDLSELLDHWHIEYDSLNKGEIEVTIEDVLIHPQFYKVNDENPIKNPLRDAENFLLAHRNACYISKIPIENAWTPIWDGLLNSYDDRAFLTAFICLMSEMYIIETIKD